MRKDSVESKMSLSGHKSFIDIDIDIDIDVELDVELDVKLDLELDVGLCIEWNPFIS